MAQPYRDEEGRCPYDQLLREGQVHCELSVVDPSNQCAADVVWHFRLMLCGICGSMRLTLWVVWHSHRALPDRCLRHSITCSCGG